MFRLWNIHVSVFDITNFIRLPAFRHTFIKARRGLISAA